MSSEEATAARGARRGSAALTPATVARRTAQAVLVAVVLGVLFDGPSFLSESDVSLAIQLFNYMAMAAAWNLLGGYGGQFSLGHGVFIALGGYVTSLLLIHTGLSLAVSVLLSALFCAAFGALSSVPLLRLRGTYFTVGTLGVLLAAQAWVINWNFAGASTGVYLPSSGILGFSTQYYLGAALLVLTILVVAGLVRSRYGLRLMAVRDDESAAAELGVNGFRVKLVAMTVSAFLVGLCGATYAFQQLSLDPVSAFSVSWALFMILSCVIGGLATLPGPLIGAALIFWLNQQFQSSSVTPLIEGAVLLVVIRFAPGGIWGLLRALPGQALALGRRRLRPAQQQ
jgi:branched-chain amino acid transport system permease protein